LRPFIKRRKGYAMLVCQLAGKSGDCATQKSPLLCGAGAAIEKKEDIVGIFRWLEASDFARLAILEDREVFSSEVRDGSPRRIVNMDLHGNQFDIDRELQGILHTKDKCRNAAQQSRNDRAFPHGVSLSRIPIVKVRDLPVN
jgi:hypothetical protein